MREETKKPEPPSKKSPTMSPIKFSQKSDMFKMPVKSAKKEDEEASVSEEASNAGGYKNTKKKAANDYGDEDGNINDEDEAAISDDDDDKGKAKPTGGLMSVADIISSKASMMMKK